MALSIKNPETYQLVRELADRTGESMTTAVTIAVRERLDRLQGEGKGKRREDLRAILRDLAPRLKNAPHFWEIDELLYDECGLPR